MTSRSGARTLGVVVAVGLGLVLSGCSIDTSSEASPFRFTAPDGSVVDATERGGTEPAWGSDSGGNIGPFTVLAPSADTTAIEDITVIEATGYEGYQGEFSQAATPYPMVGTEVVVDGRRELVSEMEEGRESGPYTELLVDRGENVAVAYRSALLTVDELHQLDRATVIDESPAVHQQQTPVVTVPAGLVSLGDASADFHVALDGCCERPGPPSAYVSQWEAAESVDLAAFTLPATAGDVDATFGFPRAGHNGTPEVGAERFDVDGRPAAFLDLASVGGGGGGERILVTTTAWGDLLVLRSYTRSTDDPATLDRDALVAIAQSVERID